MGELSMAMQRIREHDRLKWWLDGKFGLFIHWGPSSVAGVEISWARMSHPHDHPGRPTVPDAEYDQLYRRFNPVDFDANAIVKLAKHAGMKYVVFTTKHHDGFANWHTRLSDYNIANTPFRRDICRELADAVHAHGLKLGWYYSTRDWYHPDYLVGDNSAYNDFYHGQVRELLSDYGDVSLLWFDHVAGRWQDYRFDELFAMIYELQPQIIVNNRAARFVFDHKAGTPDPNIAELVKGDFDTPEGKIGVFQKDRPWESCIVMSEPPDRGGWSYRPDATTRSFAECAKMLCACVTGRGNLLLNAGPMANGLLRSEERGILEAFGPWMNTFGESLYGTQGGPYINGAWGGSTMRGNELYLHVFEWQEGALHLPPLPRSVFECRELGGEAVACRQERDHLTLIRADDKTRDTHSVVKLSLAEGAEMSLIPVNDNATERAQIGAQENPMGED
jgi:alpha-L-fucosidase